MDLGFGDRTFCLGLPINRFLWRGLQLELYVTLVEPTSLYLEYFTIGGPFLVCVCGTASILWFAIPCLPLAQLSW